MTGRPVYLAPGPRGAHNWHPMSWNPEAGLVYIPATNNNYFYQREEAFEYEPGVWNTGTDLGPTSERPSRPELEGPANVLLGWDPARNREAWRVEASGGHGGTMSTGGGLVFWGTDTRLAALDARTGEELWSAEVGRGAGSPVAYEVGGRQYVSVAAGLTAGGGAPRVWAFALDPELDGEAGSGGEAGSDGEAGAGSREWTTARPEDVGMSSEVLGRIGPAMQAMIDREATGGIMTLVARRGEIVHWDARGWRVRGERPTNRGGASGGGALNGSAPGDPLEPDDIFRVYSMTKPVTSVAAMILVEEGRLSLDDEVGSLVPAFAETQVYDDGATRPPERPIVVRDLLTHTSGLTYGIFGDTPVDSMYRSRLDILSPSSGRTLAETADLIAAMPLVADPGARWNYSVSTDVLGRVVEVASGRPLDVFFRERIFAPLGMDDTGFWVGEEDDDRFTAMYRRDREGLTRVSLRDGDPFTRPPSWFSGGAGLTSSAGDYLRFAHMLLGEGELDGVRILAPETVRLMVRNHLPEHMIPIMRGIGEQGFGAGGRRGDGRRRRGRGRRRGRLLVVGRGEHVLLGGPGRGARGDGVDAAAALRRGSAQPHDPAHRVRGDRGCGSAVAAAAAWGGPNVPGCRDRPAASARASQRITSPEGLVSRVTHWTGAASPRPAAAGASSAPECGNGAAPPAARPSRRRPREPPAARARSAIPARCAPSPDR